jgi:hypothetical protein
VGSEIDISAEQVVINGIVFTEGTDPSTDPGNVATSDYVAGTAGWKIDGDGSAEFNDVVIRGNATTGLIVSNGYSYTSGDFSTAGTEIDLTDGRIRSKNFAITSAGDAKFKGTVEATSLQLNIASDFFNFVNSAGALQLNSDGVRFEIDLNDAVFAIVNTQFEARDITILGTDDSTSKDTGSIITEGGVGIEKNLYVGGATINFANLPTSSAGLAAGDLWNDSGTLKIA